jgi:hypothetical protein
MRKIFALLLIATFATGAAFAHGGKSHLLLGTVKLLHENHLVVTATDGHEVIVTLTATTQYEKDKKPAKRSDLKPGARVSIRLTEDDKAAVKVKIGTAAAATAAAAGAARSWRRSRPAVPAPALSSAPASSARCWASLILVRSNGPEETAIRYLESVRPAWSAPDDQPNNHGWILGGVGRISWRAQTDVDLLLEPR